MEFKVRRTIFNVSIALIAFLLGLGLEAFLVKYRNANSPKVIAGLPSQTNLIDVAAPLPPADLQSKPKPGSLPSELLRLDRIYMKRCQLPTDWSGKVPTIRQLETFKDCNDQWAGALRKAIMSEIENYLIQY